MKRIAYSLFIAVALLITQAAAYQTEEYDPVERFRYGESFSIGIKGGLSVSYFRGMAADALDERLEHEFSEFVNDPLPYVTGGVFATLALSENFAFQPEVIYLRNGEHYEGVYGGETYEFDLTAEYVTFPFLIKIMAPSPDMLFRPNFFIGPVLSILLDAKATGVPQLPSGAEKIGILDNFRKDEDINDQVRSTDFGIVMGAGIDAKAGHGHFSFEIRYTTGFSNAFDKNPNAEDFKNAAVSILAGYAYDF
ncbi:MAG: outer membrane beta-barrel protein [Chitinivibrionales bacterium]|nr:outer membrane beta-barrel protein [Chitinivibrionales bacterium]